MALSGRATPIVALLGAALLAVAAGGALVVSAGVALDARAAEREQQRLLDAQRDVAKAQEALMGSSIREAIDRAEEANRAAREVGDLTARLVETLHPTVERAEAIANASERGLANARFARRQTDAAARLLAAISGYQNSSAHSTTRTNRALERILEALRELNRRFPRLLP